MSAQHFSIGKQIQWRGQPFEIKRVLPGNQLNLENIVTGAILIADLPDLIQDLYAGLLTFARDGKQAKPPRDKPSPELRYLDVSDCPERWVETARFRLMVIQPLLDLQPRTRQSVVDRVRQVSPSIEHDSLAGLHKVSVASVYRWITEYERSGRDVRSLIPNLDERGGKGQLRLEAEVEAIINSVIEDRYGTREKTSVDDIWHEVIVRIEDDNRLRAPQDKLDCPSRATIDRRIRALDIKTVFGAQHGKRAAEHQFTQFGRGPKAETPLERVEIDHTKIDLVVIDDQDNLPLGRATLTDCLDVGTRYPLGYYLGFEPPSYYAVMECLYHAICPKDSVREKYGTTHDWIAYGVPATLVTDNGKEFIGRSLEDACLALNIVLEQMPIKQAHYKGKVERLFKTVATVLHGLPGTTFSNVGQRGDYDSVGQACIYLSEVEALLNHFFLDIYAERTHKGLGGIPARRWEQALQSGYLPRVPASAEELLILLGQVDWRTIQPYGIDFESIRYNTSELALLRNQLKGEKVKIKFHPGDLSRLHVYDPFNRRYILVPAEDGDGYTVGLSLWKHRVIRRFVLNQQDKVDLVALGRAKRRIQDMVDQARVRKRASTRSRVARWDDSGQPPSLSNLHGASAPQASVTPTASLPEPPAPNPPIPTALPPGIELLVNLPTCDDWSITYDLPSSRNAQRV